MSPKSRLSLVKAACPPIFGRRQHQPVSGGFQPRRSEPDRHGLFPGFKRAIVATI
ncbi:MAG: hypothetical protein OXQ29_23310 [Rhodospirillaceae bacterium]|nr:hypothetical protein [Rhodospirillaceae bacterium]